MPLKGSSENHAFLMDEDIEAMDVGIQAMDADIEAMNVDIQETGIDIQRLEDLFAVPDHYVLPLDFSDGPPYDFLLGVPSETPETQKNMRLAVRAESAEQQSPTVKGTGILPEEPTQAMPTFSSSTTHAKLPKSPEPEQNPSLDTQQRAEVKEEKLHERASKQKARERISFSFLTGGYLVPDLKVSPSPPKTFPAKSTPLSKRTSADKPEAPKEKASAVETETQETKLRKRNREAARLNRARRKQEQIEWESYVVKLGKTNANLIKEIGLLRDKRDALKTKVQLRTEEQQLGDVSYLPFQPKKSS